MAGIIVEGVRPNEPWCIVKIPRDISLQRTEGELWTISLLGPNKDDYNALAFGTFAVRLHIHPPSYFSSLLSTATLQERISLSLSLDDKADQQLCRELVAATYIHVLFIASGAPRPQLQGRWRHWVRPAERDQMKEALGEAVLLARGVEAPWASLSLFPWSKKGIATSADRHPAFVNYAYRIRSRHVRQYTFLAYHRLFSFSVDEQVVAGILASIMSEIAEDICTKTTIGVIGHLLEAQIAERLKQNSSSPAVLPETPLWLEAPSAFPSKGRKASGALVVCPTSVFGLALKTLDVWRENGEAAQMLWMHVDKLRGAWLFEVVDPHGFPFLRLLYFPEDRRWAFSPTHQCPLKRCVFRATFSQAEFKTSALRYFGWLDVEACKQCQQEAVWWQRYLLVAVPLVLASLERERREQEYRQRKREDHLLGALGASEETASDGEPKGATAQPEKKTVHVSLPDSLLSSLAPVQSMLRWMPPFMGHLFLEDGAVLKDGTLLGRIIAVCKLPAYFPFSEVVATWETSALVIYAKEGPLLYVPLILCWPDSSFVTIPCLLSPLDERDARSIRALRSVSEATVRFFAFGEFAFGGNEGLVALLGSRTLSWTEERRHQVDHVLLPLTTKPGGSSGVAKARWWREHAQLRLQATQPAGPGKLTSKEDPPEHGSNHRSRPRPVTLLERYLSFLLEEEAEASEQKELEAVPAKPDILRALRRAYDCQVSRGALHMLFDLSAQLNHLRTGLLPSFGSPSLWFHFPDPLTFPCGSGERQAAAAFFFKETSTSALSLCWTCLLISAEARPIGMVYQYRPGQDQVWIAGSEHACPDHLCEATQQKGSVPWALCSGCEQGMAYWATLLKVLLHMLRGDYRVPTGDGDQAIALSTIEAEQIEDIRATRTRGGELSLVPVKRTVYVLQTVDAAIQNVRIQGSQTKQGLSWLDILLATHPDLLETEVVTAKRSVRTVKKTGTTYTVPEYPLTVHRRKDRERKKRLTAEPYEQKHHDLPPHLDSAGEEYAP